MFICNEFFYELKSVISHVLLAIFGNQFLLILHFLKSVFDCFLSLNQLILILFLFYFGKRCSQKKSKNDLFINFFLKNQYCL